MTYRLGSIENNSQRPLIDNTTGDIVATVVSDAGPATVGDLSIEQVVNNYGVLLSQFVNLDGQYELCDDYTVTLPGRPQMQVRSYHDASKQPTISGFRAGTDDQRMAVLAVAEFDAEVVA